MLDSVTQGMSFCEHPRFSLEKTNVECLGNKFGLGFILSLCSPLWRKTYDTEQSQQHKRTEMGVCQQRTEAKCNLSIDDVIFQMRSTERHSQVITNALLLTCHFGRANPVCEHCKANLCLCSCCTKGSAFACAS